MTEGLYRQRSNTLQAQRAPIQRKDAKPQRCKRKIWWTPISRKLPQFSFFFLFSFYFLFFCAFAALR